MVGAVAAGDRRSGSPPPLNWHPCSCGRRRRHGGQDGLGQASVSGRGTHRTAVHLRRSIRHRRVWWRVWYPGGSAAPVTVTTPVPTSDIHDHSSQGNGMSDRVRFHIHAAKVAVFDRPNSMEAHLPWRRIGPGIKRRFGGPEWGIGIGGNHGRTFHWSPNATSRHARLRRNTRWVPPLGASASLRPSHFSRIRLRASDLGRLPSRRRAPSLRFGALCSVPAPA